MTHDEETWRGLAVLPVKETRSQNDRYREYVVDMGQLPAWEASLAALFGTPLKPKGEAPSKEALKRSEPFGGIWKEQTLYWKGNADGTCFVVLMWPWQDGCHVTIKLIHAEPAG